MDNKHSSKKCFICGKVKPIDDFYTHKQMTDGHLNKCKECTRAYMKTRRDTGAVQKLDWERHHTNPDRFRKHKYYMIKHRCSASVRSNGDNNSYYGREFLSKSEWDMWCASSEKTFFSLWDAWVASGYDRNLSPSIDRIDDSKGYVVDNLQWLTSRGNLNKYLNGKWGGKRKVK